jgi:hypothetical protein
MSEDKPEDDQTLQEIENRKVYQSLLQNQVLNLQNEDLLNEIHDNDENVFYPDLYSQMQLKNDSAGPSNQAVIHSDIYCGAFAYTSPPERPLVSENVEEPHVSPFSSRYTVLKFKSDTKSDQDKISQSNNHSAPSQKNFMFKKPANLIDFHIGDQLMGKGIFQQQD